MTTCTACETYVEAFASASPVPAATGDDLAALTRGDSPAPWLDDALQAINSLAGLGGNWDSYGASAIDSESVVSARRLAEFLAGIVSVKPPVVTATPEGDVAFCWDTGNWSLDASVDRTGLISYAFIDERDPGKEYEGRTRDLNDLVEIVTRW
jgi:hypothetical protein